MDEKHKKGELEIKRWEIKKVNELNSQVIITLDKENVTKLLYGLIGLTKDNDTFYIGFNLNDFGVHFVHRDSKPVKEEAGKN